MPVASLVELADADAFRPSMTLARREALIAALLYRRVNNLS